MDLKHLKSLLASHGVNQTALAQMLGRDKSVVTNLFQGRRRLKADEAALIASHLGVTVNHVMGIEEASGHGASEPPSLIPFQSAPQKNPANRNIIEKDGRFYLEESAPVSAKTYALEVRDDSMNLAGILPGDIVISELDRPCCPGQLVIIQIYQGDSAQSTIRSYEPPLLIARSTSPNFKPLSSEGDNVRLVSPVLRLIRSF